MVDVTQWLVTRWLMTLSKMVIELADNGSEIRLPMILIANRQRSRRQQIGIDNAQWAGNGYHEYAVKLSIKSHASWYIQSYHDAVKVGKPWFISNLLIQP